jgi:hypothetical protein
MPLPTPNKGESKDDFISRCAGNETMNNEFPDQDQKLAVCYSQWRKKESMEKKKEEKIVKITKPLKIEQDDKFIILEKGTKIKVLQERFDFRELFDEWVVRKPATWQEVIQMSKRRGTIPDTEQIYDALITIIGRQGSVYPLRHIRPMDDISIFKDNDWVEYVVEVEELNELFYINTEGYDYARYAAWIPPMIAEDFN